MKVMGFMHDGLATPVVKLRGPWLMGIFVVTLGGSIYEVIRHTHDVDLSSRWGLYSVSFRAVFFGVILAYLVTIGLAALVQLISRRPVALSFFGRTSRRVRLGLIAVLLVLAGGNYYNESYHPLHFAQRTVNDYLSDQNQGQLQSLSWSPRSYQHLKQASALHLKKEDAGSEHYLNYSGKLTGERKHSVDVTLSRQRVDPLGLDVTYSVKTIEVN